MKAKIDDRSLLKGKKLLEEERKRAIAEWERVHGQKAPIKKSKKTGK